MVIKIVMNKKWRIKSIINKLVIMALIIDVMMKWCCSEAINEHDLHYSILYKMAINE